MSGNSIFNFWFDLSKFVLFHNKKSIIPGDNKDRHILTAENMEGDVIRKKNYSYFLSFFLIFHGFLY